MEKIVARLEEKIEVLNAQNAMLHARVEQVLADNAELNARLDAMEIIILTKGALEKVI